MVVEEKNVVFEGETSSGCVMGVVVFCCQLCEYTICQEHPPDLSKLHLYKPMGRLPPNEFYTWTIYLSVSEWLSFELTLFSGNRSGILSLANLP